MRKYTNITAAVLVMLLFTITSCKKSFLEIVPKGELVASTYDDYNLLMNGSEFYAYYYTGIWQPAMVMGDDVAAEEVSYNNTQLIQTRALFQYEDNIFVASPDGSSYGADNPQFLTGMLSNLYTLNKIINGVEGSSGGTSQQKLEIKAEAMATRAFTNFQLVNYFTKPYNTGTAAADPGFPMITTADITVTNFKRGTVQESYDFIVKDLTGAISNLAVQPSYITRMSKPAAEGLLGKVYLFMGKYTEALAMFNASFADVSKMATPPRLYNYNVEFAPGGSFLPIDPTYGPNSPFNSITDATESVIETTAYAGNYDGNGFGNDFLTLTPQTQALFDPADLRLNLYTNQQQDQTPIAGGRIRRFTTPYSFYERIGLEISELYLLRAEAEARTGNLAGAKADVETLRKNRMPVANASVPAATAVNQTQLIKFIVDERSREFAALGYRWFDMRRLSTDPIFSAQIATDKHTLFLTAGGTTQYTLKPERLTLRIPALYLKNHPDMVDNP